MLDTGFILKSAFILLLISIIPLAEIMLIQFLGEFLGIYFTLAVAAVTGLAGLFLAYRDIRGIVKQIRIKSAEGLYPGREMLSLAGALFGGIMLICPGFITDFIGALSFFPVIRTLAGRFITRNMEPRLREAYEYMRLYE